MKKSRWGPAFLSFDAVVASASIFLAVSLLLGPPSVAIAMIGGKLVGAKRPPHERAIVGLQILQADGLYLSNCTGTLIREDAVLTAAHCFDTSPTKRVGWVRVLPAQDIRSFVKADPRARRVVRTEIHPQYDSRAVEIKGVRQRTYDHDMAIAFLDHPLDDSFRHLRLASADGELSAGRQIVANGYGANREWRGWVDLWLDENYLKLQRGRFKISDKRLQDRVFAEEGDFSLCQGDSGGPAFAITKNKPAVLVAINSASGRIVMIDDVPHSRCKAAAVFQPIAPERYWIDRVLRETPRAVAKAVQ